MCMLFEMNGLPKPYISNVLKMVVSCQYSGKIWDRSQIASRTGSWRECVKERGRTRWWVGWLVGELHSGFTVGIKKILGRNAPKSGTHEQWRRTASVRINSKGLWFSVHCILLYLWNPRAFGTLGGLNFVRRVHFKGIGLLQKKEKNACVCWRFTKKVDLDLSFRAWLHLFQVGRDWEGRSKSNHPVL